jgi:crotonobetainyl-CoA:carnitine CoA-transferase CaiB-like acyl-CoA transferase
MALGELGADVIKVERRPGGDETRQWGPPFIEGESAYFLAINRNKKSIALDLNDREDRATVRCLALEWADILVENFRPGTLKGWNLDLSDLRLKNPRLITASIRGYPLGDDRPGYDFVIQAGSGLMSITGPVEGEPYKVGVAMADILTGLYLTTAILAAINKRHQTGMGDHVEVSLWESALASLTYVAQGYLVTGKEPRRQGNAHAQLAPYQNYPTLDGFIAIGVGNDSQFRTFCNVLDHPEWVEDVRFRTNPDRVVHRLELEEVISQVLKTQSTDYWVSALESAGIPAGPVRTVPQALQYAQDSGHDMLTVLEHPLIGELPVVRFPWRFAGSATEPLSAPPLLDQHQDEVRKLRDQLCPDSNIEVKKNGSKN